jgi:hypothetical protein
MEKEAGSVHEPMAPWRDPHSGSSSSRAAKWIWSLAFAACWKGDGNRDGKLWGGGARLVWSSAATDSGDLWLTHRRRRRSASQGSGGAPVSSVERQHQRSVVDGFRVSFVDRCSKVTSSDIL